MSNFKMVLSKFVGQRNFDECLTIRADQISQNNIQKFLHCQWKMKHKIFAVATLAWAYWLILKW